MQQNPLPPAFYEAMTLLAQAFNAMAVTNPALNAVTVNTPEHEVNPRALPACAGPNSSVGAASAGPSAATATTSPAGAIIVDSGSSAAALPTSPPAGGVAVGPGSTIAPLTGPAVIESLQTGNATEVAAEPVATCGCHCHSTILAAPILAAPSSSSCSVWYAITKGRRVGVYSSWAVVQDAVSGCRAAYRKFPSHDEAARYFNEALENQVVAVI